MQFYVIIFTSNVLEGTMERYEDKSGITKDLSCWASDAAFSRFKSFCSNVLGTEVDKVPSEQSIFMRQSLSIVFFATILFLLTNGFYLVKNIIFKTMIVIDMIPLYMMVAASLAMLIFLIFYKNYGSPLSRFVLLAFYTVVIASVTVFMVSCNFHKIGLSNFNVLPFCNYDCTDIQIVRYYIHMHFDINKLVAPRKASLCRKL